MSSTQDSGEYHEGNFFAEIEAHYLVITFNMRLKAVSSGEPNADAGSGTSERQEQLYTPRRTDERLLLHLFTTSSPAVDDPPGRVSMTTSLPSPITPTAQRDAYTDQAGPSSLHGPLYDQFYVSLPYSPIFYPLPRPPCPMFHVSESEHEFLRGSSVSAEDSLLAGLSGSVADYDISDRLLVVLRCLKRLRFDSLGEFLALLFGPRHRNHDQVVQKISAFLRQCSRLGTHPADIVDKIFNNAASELYDQDTKRLVRRYNFDDAALFFAPHGLGIPLYHWYCIISFHNIVPKDMGVPEPVERTRATRRCRVGLS